MEDRGTNADTSEHFVSALLQGGPTSFPEKLRLQRVNARNWKIKVPHRGGYEHFERVDEAGDHGESSTGQVRFRWTTRTKLAE
jgi:hypothetical protein